MLLRIHFTILLYSCPHATKLSLVFIFDSIITECSYEIIFARYVFFVHFVYIAIKLIIQNSYFVYFFGDKKESDSLVIIFSRLLNTIFAQNVIKIVIFVWIRLQRLVHERKSGIIMA